MMDGYLRFTAIVLPFIVSAIGIVLLVLLWLRLREVGSAARLSRHRSKGPGFVDLLNYASLIDDGIVLGKDGSFLAAFLYNGPDGYGATFTEMERISYWINEAFKGLGDGWALHVDAVREPAPGYAPATGAAFPDPLTQAIDDERAEYFLNQGTLYQGYFVFSINWLPPVLAESKFVELMFEDQQHNRHIGRRAHASVLLAQFRRDLRRIEDQLSIAFQLTRLRGFPQQDEDGRTYIQDDLLAWLQRCITGEYHPVRLPRTPIYIDYLVGGRDFWTGTTPRIGERYLQIVAIDGLPGESEPGMLNALSELPCGYRWSTRFIFLDRYRALADIRRYRKQWRQQIRGIFDALFNLDGPVNQDAKDMTDSADAASAELNGQLVGYGYYTSVIVLDSPSRKQVEESALAAAKAIQQLGFSARVETVNAVDAFLGSLPGHVVENVRRPSISTLNLADLLPVSSIWTGMPRAPCPYYRENTPPLAQCVTLGQTPFWLNLHVGDLGHTLIIGPTRSGKSVLLGFLATQFRRYQRLQLFAFDMGESLYPLTAALRTVSDARHHRLAADSGELGFAPLQFLDKPSDQAWAAEWMDTLLNLSGLETGPAHRVKIQAALQSMQATGAKTLSEFATTVQDTEVREALADYLIDGPMGHLLDAEEDGLDLSTFVTFEIQDLMDLGDRYALPVMLYLFRRIERGLSGAPGVIVIDEGWLILDHPVYRARLRKWLKTMAKANCAVIFATQSLADAGNAGILDIIAESTATKIFLPNIHSQDEEVAALYRRLGLNERQIGILATALPQRQYYCVSSAGRRLFELALGPLALAFLGRTDKESVSAVKTLEDRHGRQWVSAWLAQQKVDMNMNKVTREAA